MSEEKKTRVRRSNAEVRAEKKAKYLAEIEKHKEAIKVLEKKVKELENPVKTQKQIRDEILKQLSKKSMNEIMAVADFAGIEVEE